MSKTKLMRPYADTIYMMMQRDRMPSTGAYDTLNTTPSSMVDTSAHFM